MQKLNGINQACSYNTDEIYHSYCCFSKCSSKTIKLNINQNLKNKKNLDIKLHNLGQKISIF